MKQQPPKGIKIHDPLPPEQQGDFIDIDRHCFKQVYPGNTWLGGNLGWGKCDHCGATGIIDRIPLVGQLVRRDGADG